MAIPIPGQSLEGVTAGFPVLPSGTYIAEVTNTEEKIAGEEAKNPGATYVSVEFTIHDEEYEGRKAWTNVSFTEKAAGMLKSFLLGIGYPEEEVNTLAEVDPDDWEGRTARIVVTEGTNPKTKEKNNSIKRVLPLSEDESELPS